MSELKPNKKGNVFRVLYDISICGFLPSEVRPRSLFSTIRDISVKILGVTDGLNTLAVYDLARRLSTVI